MRDWEYEHKGPWDAAVRGSSALRAALLTAFGDEVATYSGLQVAKVLWDFEKFYDTISIDKLISKCNELRYPVKLTALGLMMHTAPRMLKAYDHYAMVGTPANGIIAGCTQSNHFARIFLYDIVRDTLSGSPFNYIRYEYWNDIRTFVDDVSQTVRSMQPITKLVQAARVLIQKAKHNHLIISPKTVVLASKKECR